MVEKFTTKLGTTRAGERTRIWLEGKRLTAHGWTPGAHFSRTWNTAARILTLRPVTPAEYAELARDERGTVSGKGDKPIIDIVGARVAETFHTYARVAVFIRASRIEVTALD